MTPAARYASAIEVLDTINAGEAAERVLTTWARQNRFAGSKDRAAVRDHVYDVLRARRSLAALGGGESGRQMVIGLLRRDGIDIESIFDAGGYGPTALTDDEMAAITTPATMSKAEAHDLPDWLWPIWQADLGGDDATTSATVQQMRATPMLRVNLRRTTRQEVIDLLATEDVIATVHNDVKSALYLVENARRLSQTNAFQDGLVALQDAASQIAIAHLSLPDQGRILDYCAGGGGKALAMADQCDAEIYAHDISVARMADIAPRAQAAGVAIKTVKPRDLPDAGLFDLVFCDAPCSGSGTWRRTPDAKWLLSADKLNEYNDLQRELLRSSARYVAENGQLVYATCSVLDCENGQIIDGFVAENSGLTVIDRMQLLPTAAHDGFFLAVLRRT